MYGNVLVVAGSRGMAGAAALVGASALRSGAGLVRVACPAEIQPTVATFEPSYMTYPLENDERRPDPLQAPRGRRTRPAPRARRRPGDRARAWASRPRSASWCTG